MKKWFYKVFLRKNIIFSWLFSMLEYYYRRLTGRISNEQEIIASLNERGLNKNSSPWSFYHNYNCLFNWVSDFQVFKYFELDYCKHPFVFFYDKKDDCDGYALFYEYILKNIFHFEEVYFASVFTDVEGHAVCVAKFNEGCFIIGNWSPIKIKSMDLEDVAEAVGNRLEGFSWKFAVKRNGYKFEKIIFNDIYF